MAIRTLMLRKKLSDSQKELEALKTKATEIESRKAELATREAELEESVNEASTDEEKAVVEEEVAKFEADTEAIDKEAEENAQKISDLENEVSEMERELEAKESEQRAATVPGNLETRESEQTEKTIETRKEDFKMYRSKILRRMNVQEREAFVASDEMKNFVSEVRSAIEKRGVTNGAYTIGTSVVGYIREEIAEYSKLYRKVNVVKLSGKGREIVMGTYPEAYWEEACDPIQELSASFAQVELDGFKVAGFIPVCNALLEDSDIDLADALIVAIGAAIGRSLDKAILYGTGVKMPTGVVTAIAADSDLDDTNLITIPSASSTGTALFKSLIGAAAVANSDYAHGEMTWVMNKATYSTILSESVSINAVGAVVAGVNKAMPIDGGEIIVLSFVPDKNIVAGYFDLYTLGERKGITLDQSEHVKFIEDQTVFRGRARFDGKPAIVSAFVAIGIDNTTPSESISINVYSPLTE